MENITVVSFFAGVVLGFSYQGLITNFYNENIRQKLEVEDFVNKTNIPPEPSPETSPKPPESSPESSPECISLPESPIDNRIGWINFWINN